MLFEVYLYSGPTHSPSMANISSSESFATQQVSADVFKFACNQCSCEQAHQVNAIEQKVKIALETSADQIHKLEAKVIAHLLSFVCNKLTKIL